MYEVHGWFALSDSTWQSEDAVIVQALEELRPLITAIQGFNMDVELRALNGQYHLTISGYRNRPRDDAAQIEALMRFTGERLPGSYGLLYERDDETTRPPGPNAFRVRVMARGQIEERADPFLSPCQPTIED